MLPRLPLSIAMIGLHEPTPLRERIEWAASLGFRAAQLNAAEPQSRPRDLSRSALRDMAALLRRHGLSCSGIDLFIPPAHYTDPAHADRASDAVSAAIAISADLASLVAGRAVVCVTLPDDPAASGIIGALADRARTAGAWLADASWPSKWATIGVARCIDPAAVILSNADGTSPAKALASSGPAAVSARLSDISPTGPVEPGTGRLDLLAYLAALTTCPAAGAPVLDLRGIADAEGVAARIVARCGDLRPT